MAPLEPSGSGGAAFFRPDRSRLEEAVPNDPDAPRGLPLEGIRVADFSRVLAGPLATMVLADLGADVIKVERPETGDDTRGWGPPFLGEEAAYFLSLNRNKRSVVLDLATDEGRTAARLALSCDVVVENSGPASWNGSGWTTRPCPLSVRTSSPARSQRSATARTRRPVRATTSSCRRCPAS